jgi:hypothetical protein
VTQITSQRVSLPHTTVLIRTGLPLGAERSEISATRETISGTGCVTIGACESKVQAANLNNDIISCDAGHAQAAP